MLTLKNIYSHLPQPARNYIRTSWMKSSFRKRRNIKKSKKLKANRLAAIEKHGTFDANELLQFLGLQGINKGDVLFVQSSFNDLYTLIASPLELIAILKELVGDTGTLLMPAYTIPKSEPDWIFDHSREATYTGIVNEIFRRSAGVIRSIHPRHSICGYGSLAEELLKDHHKCKYADGKNSPFDRMRKLKNAKILTLGLPPCYLSFLHWIEDIETNKLPFTIHKDVPEKYTLTQLDGSLHIVEDYQINKENVTLSLPRICNKISTHVMYQIDHKGVSISIYLMKPLADELIKLRDQNIIHYQ